MKQVCPICLGHGLVQAGFYSHAAYQETYSVTNASPEMCRACQGMGVIETQ